MKKTKRKNDPNDEFLSVLRAAEYMQVGKSYMYDLLKKEGLMLKDKPPMSTKRISGVMESDLIRLMRKFEMD